MSPLRPDLRGWSRCSPSSAKSFTNRVHIEVDHDKTQVWNRSGVLQSGIEALTRAASVVKPDAVVWKGDSNLPPTQQGLKVLGVPLGQPAYIREFLENKSREQTALFERIPWVNDPQAVWLFLMMCASTRANFWLRAVRPELTEAFATRHDANVWNCLRTILGTPRAPASSQVLSSLALSAGGLGLASAHRARVAAHWVSWVDCVLMVRRRLPVLAENVVSRFRTRRCTMFLGGEELQAAAQICREAGARVSTNVFVRDLDLAALQRLGRQKTRGRGRRVDLVPRVPNSPLTPPWLLHCTATVARGGGLQMSTARRWKRQDAARRGPALSCLAMVEGPDWWCWPQKWGDGGARRPPSSSPPWPWHARCPFVPQGRVEAAWIRRWSAILACSAARAFSWSLLDQRPVPQVCDIPSAHEVLRDDRFTWGLVSLVL